MTRLPSLARPSPRATRLAWLLMASWALLLSACPSERIPALGDPCRSLEDCGGVQGLSCRDATCVEIACTRSASCPRGAACVKALCQAPQCLTSADCPSAARHAQCFEGACREDLCRDKAQCGPEQVCLGVPPTCKTPPELCLSDAECPGQTRCQMTTQRCVALCQDDAQCDATQHCDEGFCRSRCGPEQACEPGELCINARCRLRPDCSQQAPCPSATPLRRPEDCVCVACLNDADCEPGRDEACLNNQCIYCPVQGVDAAVCAGLGLPHRQSCCTGCVLDSDCQQARGERCERGRCVDMLQLSCSTDGDCPAGTLCDGSRCSATSSLAPCARQQDCPQGQSCSSDGRCREEPSRCQGGCPTPSRCVAEPADTRGACVGCAAACDTLSCPSGQRCDKPDPGQDGVCVSDLFWPMQCP